MTSIQADTIAKLVLRQFWLSQVRRVSEDCLDRKTPCVMVPPTDDQYRAASELIESACMEHTSEMAIASGDE